jgi:predicted ester cyclase
MTSHIHKVVDDWVLDYELGRLLVCQGDHDSARKEFELVISGKHLEVGPSGKKVRMLPFIYSTADTRFKGKYSMEVRCR